MYCMPHTNRSASGDLRQAKVLVRTPHEEFMPLTKPTLLHRCLTLSLLVGALFSANTPAQEAKTADRASMEAVQVPSHGALMNGIVYVAQGAGPHPVVVLLHGFPGNEQNLDLAQEIRRAGWDVLYFHYRGSWGSPGDYSFSNGVEDTAAAVAYLRDPAVAKKLRADSSRIVLLGHSVGGFNAIMAGSADPSVEAVGIISAADMGGRVPPHIPKFAEGIAHKKVADALTSQGLSALRGCTADTLAQDILDHASAWRFDQHDKKLATRPFLAITSDDGNAKSNDDLAEAMRKDGDTHVTTQHFATDHSYSDKRQEMSAAVVAWLQGLPTK
jgi:pimeloyl-ACP methyl ester carboxylesterase